MGGDGCRGGVVEKTDVARLEGLAVVYLGGGRDR